MILESKLCFVLFPAIFAGQVSTFRNLGKIRVQQRSSGSFCPMLLFKADVAMTFWCVRTRRNSWRLRKQSMLMLIRANGCLAVVFFLNEFLIDFLVFIIFCIRYSFFIKTLSNIDESTVAFVCSLFIISFSLFERVDLQIDSSKFRK